MSQEEEETGFVVIPHTRLSGRTLNKLIENFVLREGTDYGVHEYSLAQKVEDVISQIQQGKVEITYSLKDETFDIRRCG